jgi:ABC-2 type transport system ATP-binding protein
MIQVQNLIKVFGTKVAVDDISFSVEKGEVLGFLGPNGAGKSTTMRMVTGYFRPTSGSVSLCGIDMLENPEAAKQRLGYLPENAPLYSDMTVASFLGFCAEMRGLHGAARNKAIDRVLDDGGQQAVALAPVESREVQVVHGRISTRRARRQAFKSGMAMAPL